MNQLRVGATVVGSDGDLGKVDALIVDPTTPAVTHVVVAPHRLGPRLLVGVAQITDASPDTIAVKLDAAALDRCDRFDEPNFDLPDQANAYDDLALDPGSYFLEPYVSPIDGWALAEHERVPKGEVSIRRGDEVRSSDAHRVGHIDEFLVDPSDGHITHVVLRQGHVFRHDDDVVIPVGATTRFEEGQVVLALDLEQVEALPKIPVKRHRHVETPGG
jgi:sporulation protein YlmC with PRC-barrel domain